MSVIEIFRQLPYRYLRKETGHTQNKGKPIGPVTLRDFPSCADIESTLGLFLAHWDTQRSGPYVVPAAISQPESPDLDEFQRRFIRM